MAIHEWRHACSTQFLLFYYSGVDFIKVGRTEQIIDEFIDELQLEEVTSNKI